MSYSIQNYIHKSAIYNNKPYMHTKEKEFAMVLERERELHLFYSWLPQKSQELHSEKSLFSLENHRCSRKTPLSLYAWSLSSMFSKPLKDQTDMIAREELEKKKKKISKSNKTGCEKLGTIGR